MLTDKPHDLSNVRIAAPRCKHALRTHSFTSAEAIAAHFSLVIAAACSNGTMHDTLPEGVISAAAWSDDVDTLPGLYTRVMRPSEFYDSILVVPDVGEGMLWRVNTRSAEMQPLGSAGRGPGEYPRVSWALKVHADSVAIVQGSVYTPFPVISVASGRGRTHRVEATADSLGRLTRALRHPFIQFADTLGYLYAALTRFQEDTGVRPWPRNAASSAVATVPRIRLALSDGALDTSGVVPVALKARDPLGAPRTGAKRVRSSAGPYSPYNGWLTLPDGRSVLAGGANYVLAVGDAKGDIEEAWTIEHSAIAVSAKGFDAWQDNDRRTSANLLATTLSRANVERVPAPQEHEYPPMPGNLPALNFAGIRSMHGSGDVVWIPVHVEDPPSREVWDLINIVERRRVCRIALEQNQRLLLVTSNGAYVAAMNDADLEQIVRLRMPASDCA